LSPNHLNRSLEFTAGNGFERIQMSKCAAEAKVDYNPCMPQSPDDLHQDPPPVAAALTALAIPHRVFRHTGVVTSLEQAAAERGQRPSQVVRSILFRLGADRFALVLVAGPDQVDWKTLRQVVGQSRLTMASPDEVLAVTGYPIGAVSPFGLPAPLPIYLDRSVIAEAEISIGSGWRNITVILRSADLQQALPTAVVGDFRVTKP
jgi:Cys-tRNA(Pro) deacylase